jgi:hypothetical protein
LLLYHGLGTGKTCTAILVSEEMREYNQHMNINKHIIFMSSTKVRQNFKDSFFDEAKLQFKDGLWTLGGCIGDKLLKETTYDLNTTTETKDHHKDIIANRITQILNRFYLFYGYREIANRSAEPDLLQFDVKYFTSLSIDERGKLFYVEKDKKTQKKRKDKKNYKKSSKEKQQVQLAKCRMQEDIMMKIKVFKY